MKFFRCSRLTMWIGLLGAILMVVGACDVPTSGPSFETETGLNSPVVVDKTFAFLGGPESQHEPLIDTTTSRFDSLFTVSESDQSLSIEEDVSSFDIGSLDQALDEATEGVGVNTSLSETVIQGSGLATQDVNVDQFREENGRPRPTPSQETEDPLPVVEGSIDFPAELLEIPDFQIASIQADRVERGTLTDETEYKGSTYEGPVNRITFTLENVDSTIPDTLTDGEGGAPIIEIRDDNGQSIIERPFNKKIGPGELDSIEVRVEGETLGENSELELTVKGNDPTSDELRVRLSPTRYQEATLAGNNLQVNVTVTRTGLSTRPGTGGSQFAGIETRSGTLQLDVTNNLQFPIEIDSLVLENDLQNSELPESFPKSVDELENVGSIEPEETRTLDVDLDEKGIADTINVRVKGGLADSRTSLTTAATDNIEVAAGGGLTIGAMYFWPDGEEVQAGGTFDFEQDRISFDQPADFVELDGGILSFSNIVSEPTVGFKSFVLSFPEIRREPYGEKDSLTVTFDIEPDQNPEDSDRDLSNLRLLPTNNEVEYNLQGTLETISESNQRAGNLRVIKFDDAVQTDVSVGALDVRALDTGVTPFSVDVTEDVDGDGQLDLADDQEATQESFDGFDGIAESVDGLQVTGSELNFQVTTDVGTDAQLVAALQGRGGSSPVFLSGEKEKSVPSNSTRGDSLVDGGMPIDKQELIQFEVSGPTQEGGQSIPLNGGNSNIDDFISTLPTSLHFVAQARLTGDDNGQIRLRRPIEFDAGLSATVPLTLNNSFVVKDTIDADFSSLDDVTDPAKDVTVSTAELRVKYANGVPLGSDATLIVLDENEEARLTLPGEDETFALQPAPKGSEGRSDGARSGKTSLDLSKQQLRDLSDGRSVALRLTMNQVEDGTAAVLRASDTIELSLEAKVEASVGVNN